VSTLECEHRKLGQGLPPARADPRVGLQTMKLWNTSEETTSISNNMMS
jgi:hypothetical protein